MVGIGIGTHPDARWRYASTLSPQYVTPSRADTAGGEGMTAADLHVAVGSVITAKVAAAWRGQVITRTVRHVAHLHAKYSPARPHGDQAERASRGGGRP